MTLSASSPAVSLCSVTQMHAAARALAPLFLEGGIVGLKGPLGAGKTEFTRGVACALGVSDEICSPTFILEAVYSIPESGKTLHHWDLYRVPPDYWESELHEYRGDASKVVLVEWPEKVQWLEPDLMIEFAFAENGEARTASFSGRWAERALNLLRECGAERPVNNESPCCAKQ